jgi:hypothetical protein
MIKDILPLITMIIFKNVVLLMHDNDIGDDILYQYSSVAFTLLNTMEDFYAFQSLKLLNKGEIPLYFNFFYQLSVKIVNHKYTESSAIDFNNISDYPSSEWKLKQRY